MSREPFERWLYIWRIQFRRETALLGSCSGGRNSIKVLHMWESGLNVPFYVNNKHNRDLCLVRGVTYYHANTTSAGIKSEILKTDYAPPTPFSCSFAILKHTKNSSNQPNHLLVQSCLVWKTLVTTIRFTTGREVPDQFVTSLPNLAGIYSIYRGHHNKS